MGEVVDFKKLIGSNRVHLKFMKGNSSTNPKQRRSHHKDKQFPIKYKSL